MIQTLKAVLTACLIALMNETAEQSKEQYKVHNSANIPYVEFSIETTTPEMTSAGSTTDVTTVYSETIPLEEETPENDLILAENTMPEISNSFGLSDEDYRLLVLTVYLEAGNQSFECMKGVASVCVNRVNSSRFPDDFYSVLVSSGEFTINFSCTDTPYEDCYSAVDYILANGSEMPEGVNYFHAVYSDDAWSLSREVYCQIGDVVFTY